jgi:hypothetical protein
MEQVRLQTTRLQRAGNEFTYNYNTATSKLNNDPLLGAWRGINRYYYDTEQPREYSVGNGRVRCQTCMVGRNLRYCSLHKSKLCVMG